MAERNEDTQPLALRTLVEATILADVESLRDGVLCLASYA